MYALYMYVQLKTLHAAAEKNVFLISFGLKSKRTISNYCFGAFYAYIYAQSEKDTNELALLAPM